MASTSLHTKVQISEALRAAIDRVNAKYASDLAEWQPTQRAGKAHHWDRLETLLSELRQLAADQRGAR